LLEDCAKRDFSFLFGKSAVLVPRPHQIFDFDLSNSNSIQYPLHVFYAFKPKMPYYGLAIKAQAVVIRALGTPLKAVT